MAVIPATRLARPRWWPGVVAWPLWALVVLGLAPLLWLDHLLRQVGRPDLTQVLIGLPVHMVGVGAATVGALLITRRPRHPVGWLLLVFGLASTVTGVIGGYANYLAATRPGEPAAAGSAPWWPPSPCTRRRLP